MQQAAYSYNELHQTATHSATLHGDCTINVLERECILIVGAGGALITTDGHRFRLANFQIYCYQSQAHFAEVFVVS
jgi:hypothetical protein